jgi:hypothetical protein
MFPTRVGLAATVLAFAFGSSAGAGTLDFAKFYTGTTAYGLESPLPPFSGANTVYADTKSLATNCPNGSPGCGAADILNTSLVYSGFLAGVTITATVNSIPAASGINEVWHDLAPNFGGLGVGTGSPSDSEQIAGAGTSGDVLTLKFSTAVTLTGIGTLFDNPHTPFGTGFGTPQDVAAADTAANPLKFQLSVDGGAFVLVTFDNANGLKLLDHGTTFQFKEASNNPEFYVSALSWQTPSTQLTPIPGALLLFASAGLGGLGLLGWNRKRKNAAAIAAA